MILQSIKPGKNDTIRQVRQKWHATERRSKLIYE